MIHSRFLIFFSILLGIVVLNVVSLNILVDKVAMRVSEVKSEVSLASASSAVSGQVVRFCADTDHAIDYAVSGATMEVSIPSQGIFGGASYPRNPTRVTDALSLIRAGQPTVSNPTNIGPCTQAGGYFTDSAGRRQSFYFQLCRDQGINTGSGSVKPGEPPIQGSGIKRLTEFYCSRNSLTSVDKTVPNFASAKVPLFFGFFGRLADALGITYANPPVASGNLTTQWFVNADHETQ